MAQEVGERVVKEMNRALEIAEDYFATRNNAVIPYSKELLSNTFLSALEELSKKCERAKTAFTNIITSLAIKAVLKDTVDTRFAEVQVQHLTSKPLGFSPRPISEDYVFRWLSNNEFVYAKSGWQTRTFERPKPYMLDYAENIKYVKESFLTCYDQIETQGQDAFGALVFLFWKQLQLRDAQKITLAIPMIIDVLQIADYFHLHFTHKYKNSRGASRLPVLAFHAIYAVLLRETDRFRDKKLKPLESHSAADARTGALGDVEITHSDGTIFEALEIKHEVVITTGTIESVKKKIRGSCIDRYYILTTHTQHEPTDDVIKEIDKVKNSLGCQLICNGVIPSIKYYLRLLSDASLVFPEYAGLLSTDPVIAYEHKDVWNKIASGEITR